MIAAYLFGGALCISGVVARPKVSANLEQQHPDAVPYAMYLDGISFTNRDSLIGIFVYNVYTLSRTCARPYGSPRPLTWGSQVGLLGQRLNFYLRFRFCWVVNVHYSHLLNI